MSIFHSLLQVVTLTPNTTSQARSPPSGKSSSFPFGSGSCIAALVASLSSFSKASGSLSVRPSMDGAPALSFSDEGFDESANGLVLTSAAIRGCFFLSKSVLDGRDGSSSMFVMVMLSSSSSRGGHGGEKQRSHKFESADPLLTVCPR